MIVEVIAVGTELLLGQIVNTNVARIGGMLADEGWDSHYQVTVGDNLERLTDSIRTAMARADAVIITGGIGPTQDDLTREAICAATGRAMERDDAYAETIRERILARRGHVSPSVLRMAEYPAGAEPLPNPQGVALGIALDHQGTLVFATPGVPREMTALMTTEILPRLRAAGGGPTAIRSRVLHTWGHGESWIAETLDDLYEATNPSIAFLIADMEVRVRITAKAATEGEANDLIEPVEAEIRHRLGDAVFATDDDTNLDVIRRDAATRGWTIAAYEVGTAGQVSTRLATGAPEVFGGSSILGNGESPLHLARNALRQFGTEVGLGVSPARVVDDSGQPASLMGFGVVTPLTTVEREMRFFGEGERAHSYAAIAALHVLRQAIQWGS